MNINGDLSERTMSALSQPDIAWASSEASAQELGLRLRGLMKPPGKDNPPKASIQTPKASIQTPKAFSSPAASNIQERSPWEHLMPDLHNPSSGRLDSVRVAEWLGLSLKTLAGLINRGYATVHKTPDAAALQDKLKVFLRIASALSHLAGSHTGARIWLNAPNPDLEDNQTPLSAIKMGEQEIIAELLEDALAGQPG